VDLSVIFLGTGGSVPSARRSTASVLVARGGERLMFDCGEGTQRQLQRSLGLTQVDEIYLTHFHADHVLGLPGLLKTYDLTDRLEPLTIYGPPGLGELFKSFGRLLGRLGFELALIELGPGDAVTHEGYAVRPFAVEHGVRAHGYALIEEQRPGRFDLEAAQKLGVPEGPAFATLQSGGVVEGKSGPVRPIEVMGESRPGRTIVISGDTAPCNATAQVADGAELLIHDASFCEQDAQRAAETGHSTVGQAAAVAREAAVKLLALVHISSRYHVGAVLKEAREVFEPIIAPRDLDVVEVPFPERGEPRLIPAKAGNSGGGAGADSPAP
jgi:ribonuclease Z